MKSNPFATRFVQPGQIPWLGEVKAKDLAEQFFAQSQPAAIVGPHGSGKSTLLEHMQPHLGRLAAKLCFGELRFRIFNRSGDIVWLQLRRATASPLRSLLGSRTFWKENRVLVVDGYEQLGLATRLWLPLAARLKSMRMLVTCHAPQWGLQTLHQTHVSPHLASEIAELLVRQPQKDATESSDAGCAALCCPDRLATALEKHKGNLREVLMEWYDLYQQESILPRHCSAAPKAE